MRTNVGNFLGKQEKGSSDSERAQGGARALRGVRKGCEGGRGEPEMGRGKDVERSYKIAQRHCWARQHTFVLTSTRTFTGTLHQQHEEQGREEKRGDSLIEGWALQGSRGLGRKWLQEDTWGPGEGGG